MGLFIIAVIVLLICVCLSRVGSEDLRGVAVAVEVVFSIATVGAAISLPFAITRNIQIIGKHGHFSELRARHFFFLEVTSVSGIG